MRLRFALTSCVLLALVGCAANRPVPVARVDEPIISESVATIDDAPAMALVFDPEVTLDQPPLELSREGRERAAFVGFEEQTVSTFYIRVDDRQLSIGTGWGRNNLDRYERRAIIEKTGALYR